MAITAPTDIANLLTWCEAQSLVAGLADGDDVTTWTKSGGSVSSSPTQATAARKPHLRYNRLGGKAVVEFTAADTHYLTCGAASDYNAMHNGVGGTGFAVFCIESAVTNGNPNTLHILFDNTSATSTNRGFALWYDDRASVPREDTLVLLVTAGGSQVLNPISASDTIFAQTWYAVVWSYKDQTGNDYNVRINRRNTISGAQVNPPSASNATSVLQVGRAASAIGYLNGYLAEFGFYSAELTSGNKDDLADYLRTKYGLALAYAEVDKPTGTKTTIATGGTPDHHAFPHLDQKANGSLYITYRDGDDHQGNNGIIVRKTCDVDGGNLSSALTIQDDATYDTRECASLRLANGSRAIAYGLFNDGPNALIGVKCRVSTLDDDTYGSEISVTSSFDLAAQCGRLIQLASGRVLLPIYGKDTADTFYSCELVYSDDNCATWSVLSTIGLGATYSANLNEPFIRPLANGNLLCLIREDTNLRILRSLSTDSGATWSALTYAFEGFGRPAFISTVNAAGVEVCGCMFRKGYGGYSQAEALLRFSSDGFKTSSEPVDLDDSTVLPYVYGDFFNRPGEVWAVWAHESATSTDASIYHRLAWTYETPEVAHIEGASAGATFTNAKSITATLTAAASSGSSHAARLAALALATAAAEAADSHVAKIIVAASHSQGAIAGETNAAQLAVLASSTNAAEADDSHAATMSAAVATSEGAKAGDAADGEVSLSGASTNGAVAGGSSSATASLLAAITTAAQAGEITTAQTALLAATVNAAAASDSFSAAVVRRVSVIEAAEGGDSQAATLALVASTTDGVEATDVVNSQAALRASVTAGAVAGSSFGGLFSIAASVLEAAEASATFFTPEDEPTPGCLHTSNSPRYLVDISDRPRYRVRVSQSPRYEVCISDRKC